MSTVTVQVLDAPDVLVPVADPQTVAVPTVTTDIVEVVVPGPVGPPNNLGAPNTQTGAGYTLVPSDINKAVEGNRATAQTFTVPSNASAPFDIGAEVVLRQIGAGQITVAAAGGVTVRSRDAAYKFAGQYSEATLTKRATDEWVLSGDLVV